MRKLTHTVLLYFQVKIWFQNRRVKQKKEGPETTEPVQKSAPCQCTHSCGSSHSDVIKQQPVGKECVGVQHSNERLPDVEYSGHRNHQEVEESQNDDIIVT